MSYKKTYAGLLSINEYACLECGDDHLIDQINDDFTAGDKVFVRYYLADKPITEEEATLALVLKTIGGNIDSLDFILEAYSEYTVEECNEEFIIGGHDLFQELQEAEGKYLLLIIEKVEEGK
jgi:hypothetical protein